MKVHYAKIKKWLKCRMKRFISSFLIKNIGSLWYLLEWLCWRLRPVVCRGGKTNAWKLTKTGQKLISDPANSRLHQLSRISGSPLTSGGLLKTLKPYTDWPAWGQTWGDAYIRLNPVVNGWISMFVMKLDVKIFLSGFLFVYYLLCYKVLPQDGMVRS